MNHLFFARLAAALLGYLVAEGSAAGLDLEGARKLRGEIIDAISSGAGGSAMIASVNADLDKEKSAATYEIDQGQILSKEAISFLLKSVEKAELASGDRYEDFIRHQERVFDYQGLIVIGNGDLNFTFTFLEGDYVRLAKSRELDGVRIESEATEELILVGSDEMLFELARISQDTGWRQNQKNHGGDSVVVPNGEGNGSPFESDEISLDLSQKEKLHKKAEMSKKVKPNSPKKGALTEVGSVMAGETSGKVKSGNNIWVWLSLPIVLLGVGIAFRFLILKK